MRCSMKWIDLLRMSIQSLKRRRLRTFLTVLGVVIGTASIVIMISIGLGLQQSMYEEMAQSGGMTAITVSSGGDSGGYGVYGGYGGGGSSPSDTQNTVYTTDDALARLREVPHVRSAEPVIRTGVLLKSGEYTADVVLVGTTQAGFASWGIPLAQGANLPQTGQGNMELLFGNMVLSTFYDKTGDASFWITGELPPIDLLSDQIFLILDTETYYSSMSEKGHGDGAAMSDPGMGSAESASPGTGAARPRVAKKHVVKGCGLVAGDPSEYGAHAMSVYCDIDTLHVMMKKEFAGRQMPGQPTGKNGKRLRQFVYSYITVQADDVSRVEELATQIREMGFSVSTNAEFLKSMQKELAMVQAVLGGIGAISLLVAAIGITNTMMMSIYERTKEIGVMKVIGCSLKNIRQLFLMEAAFIGLLGGVIGNVFSVIVSFAMNRLAKGHMGSAGQLSYIPLWLVTASIVFAIFVGIVSGYFPARRAMRLSPLAAIRNQ